ncbi:MAG: permease [Patescibacteria group bacterium]|nr:permease [Patescibacteria group bacterium]
MSGIISEMDGREPEPEQVGPELVIAGFFVAGLIIIFALITFFKDQITGLGLLAVSGGLSLNNLPNLIPEQLQTFITLTLSLVVEGLPFVILGVLLAMLIRVFVPASVMMRILPKQRHLRRVGLALLGMAMPVCECGNVPVARSLISQGMSPQDVTVFLLAAPIINPITFLATWEAFGFARWVAVTRLVAALVIALVVAAGLDRLKRPEELLEPAFVAACRIHAHAQRVSRWREFLEGFQTELWLIVRLLCIGALIAAATQTIVPREVIVAIGSNMWLSLLSMLGLALVVSICSGVDAFFALSYANSFPLGSVVTFLIASPMINVKSLSLMKSTFNWRYLGAVVPVVAVLAVLVGLVVNMVVAK